MSDGNVLIRRAESRDLNAIKRLADENRAALGFVLRPALAAAIEQGWVLVAEQAKGELVGFVHYRHRRDAQTTLHEICVADGFRTKGIGRRLVVTLVMEAAALEKTRIQLKAPVDIPANAFYQTVGFALERTEPGKKRPINVWTYAISGKTR
jgi:N-acetylglutamate synthase-like GNAT family acetyltransferase